MNKFVNDKLPQKIVEIVQRHIVEEGPTTRSVDSKVLKLTNNRKKQSFILEIINIWNNTSLKNRTIKEISQLKRKILADQNKVIKCTIKNCPSC